MASETTVVTTTTTDIIEVPAEAKTLVINPPSDAAIIPEITTNGNGTSTAAAPTTTTADEVPLGEKLEEKKVIDPRENPVEWIKGLIPAGVHKANHQILTWIQNQTFSAEEEKQPLPGKNDAVTKNQFINFLKDGTLLGKLANTLAPGSIEKVYDGEEAKTKENQVTNVQNFINFIKEKAGLTETEVFTVDDLQEKGKSGYNAVFNTIFQLGLKAQEKFNATGIDVDAVIEAASTAAKNSIIQTILNFFKRARPQLKSKTEAASEVATSNGTNGHIEDATPLSNGETTKVIVDDIPPPVPTSSAPVVAAQ